MRVHCCAITCCATNANATVLSIVNQKKNICKSFFVFLRCLPVSPTHFFVLFRVSAQTQDNVEWTAVSVCQHERLFLIIWPSSRPKCYTSQTTLRISFVSIEGHWENDSQQFLGNGLIFDYVLGCCIFF